MRAAFRGLLLAALVFPSVGCGYALVGRTSNLPDDVRSVYLAPFQNLTRRAEVEQFLTQAIADELLKRRRFDIVSSQFDADAVLGGAVTNFLVIPVAFEPDGRASEYEITIIASVRFSRPGAEPDDSLWSADQYVFRTNYDVELESSSFFDQENIAIEETSLAFAETMVADLLEGF